MAQHSTRRRHILAIAAVCLMGLAAVRPSAAQDISLDDELFGAPGAAEAPAGPPDAAAGPESVAPAAADAADAAAVLPGGVRLGGRLRLGSGLASDPASWDSSFVWKDDVAASLDLGIRLFVDARPSDDFRVYLNAEATSPFDSAANFAVRELFTDLTIEDALFIRLGKQTINWGVGRWFSPANIVNLTGKDPTDPDADLLGPIAAKVQLPVGSDNYYAYGIFEDMASRKNIGLALKGEWLIGGAELGLGGTWRPDEPWAVAATLSGSLGSFDLYAEGLFKSRDGRKRIVEDPTVPTGIRIEERPDEPVGAATAGVSWSWNDDPGWINLRVAGQYYWNGAGYADQSLLADHQAGIAMALAGGQLTRQDLREPGQHYAAASLALNDLFKSHIALTGTWIGNLPDGSGSVTAGLAWTGIEHIRLSLQYTQTYGATGSEFAPHGAEQRLRCALELASGDF